MAKTQTPYKPEESVARDYADQLILESLTDLYEVVKPSELAEKLSSNGIGLATVRSLLASNTTKFAYAERRWVPAARIESNGRPLHETARVLIDRFGGLVPIDLMVRELARSQARDPQEVETALLKIIASDSALFLARDGRVASADIVFVASDEPIDRAFRLNGVTQEEVDEVEKKLGKMDWSAPDATVIALETAAPVSVKALGAAAWCQLNPQATHAPLRYNWKVFNGELLSVPGFVYASDGKIYPESETKKWLSTAIKLAEKAVATIEVEEAAPIELKKSDTESAVGKIIKANETVTATSLLEELFEVTPTVRTFPDDMRNLMTALNADSRVWWVGGDRYRKPGSGPDYINDLPEPFSFVATSFVQDDGDPVDVELIDDGLSSSLRKLIVHPLAMDVNDEDVVPAPKVEPEAVRCVLKPIHRELGTYPLSQFPTGWFEDKPEIQELILIDKDGRELQVWLNTKHRLLFGLFDWWLDQPVESGAVFSIKKTHKPNVLEFAWIDQTDPVVYISNQRMEELREISGRADELSTFDILREVMTHWPKGADFLTILWEVNVVRRTSRRLLASLLSSYVCFYQRSGSPVWHYDHKKVEQGFDKTKKKFVLKS